MTAESLSFDVVGAARARAYFGALEPAELSHGYLFTGPAGVGKKTFARRLAQSLFCVHPKASLLGYDDACPPCRSFLAGSYPDYYEAVGDVAIGGEGESAVDDERAHARGLVRELGLRPYSGRWRVAMLGDVHFVSDAAAHALLKFFEEPPPDVLIVLTTDAPGVLFDTIRSRLVEIAFAPLSDEQVAGILRAEGVAADDARIAAACAMGSVTRARAILQGAETGLREAALAWLDDSLAGRTPDASFLDRGPKAADKRKIAGELLEFVRAFARDWAALGFAGREAPLLAEDLRARIARMPRRPNKQRADALAAIAAAQARANTNVTPALVLDYLRMQLAPESG
jgi:DNA polymerase III subunit delta'